MTRPSLGLAATSYLSVWQTIDALDFLQRAHAMNAAGIQAVLNCDPVVLRARLDEYEMYFEAMVPLPTVGDTTAFERSLQDAKAAGATALRAACLGTRRYETFSTLEDWQTHVQQSHQSLESALPLLEKYKIPLGLENHKDWTADELVAIMKAYSSEYLGVCLDFGNNIALCDAPMEAIEALAPYTVTTHVKDIAVARYDRGILLSEVILGEGVIDLPRAISLIKNARFNLEMITRPPLPIPLLAGSYWTTLTDKKAIDFSRTLNYAKDSKPLLNLANSEDENIRACLTAWQAL